ncbi:MAG: LPS assembly lipoprotein LptE [Gammaproteobacteria bacterium]
MSSSDRAQRSLFAALVLVISGCGFHFRGTADLPPRMGVIHIQAADRYSPFYRELVTVLRRSDVKLTDDPATARTVINVLTDDTGRRLLSVTARNVPAEYEVYYRVRFAVTVDGVEEVPVEQLALTREFVFDENRVLGKAAEEETIREAIASDLVGLVTRRLAAVR